MNKKFIILLFLLFCGTFSFSQNVQLIDSLHKSIKSHPAEDQRKFELLSDLAWEHRWANPDSTIYYSQKAVALGKKLNISKGLAEPLNFMGVAYN